MAKSFASDRYALGICDRCGFTYKLRQLRKETVNLVQINILVCDECWDADHPQNQIGRIDYSDPQALRNPRIDTGETASTDGNDLRYDYDTGVEGWVAGGSDTLVWSGDNPGTILLTTGASDGHIHKAVTLTASTYNTVRVRVDIINEVLESDWIGRFAWKRTTDSNITDQTIDIGRPMLSQMGDPYHLLSWDVAGDSKWNGTIEAIRISLHSGVGQIAKFDYVLLEQAYQEGVVQ